jgi:Spy/CpxP family protein refolding chaperone
MISFRSSLSVSIVALVAALAGCSGGVETQAWASTGDNLAAVSAPAANGAQSHHRFASHERGGADSLIRTALRAPINLSAAQRTTIEGLAKKDVSQKPEGANRGAKLAAAIRSNTVESLQAPAPDAAARDARIAAKAAKLTALHDTLTPEQRAQLVDAVAKRGAEHTAHRSANGAKASAGRARSGRGSMRMLEGLDLTQAQEDAIKAKLDANRPAPTPEQKAQWKAQRESMRAAREAKLETFKTASFDAKAFVTPVQGNRAPDASAHHVNRLAVVTSVLTPAQREILAKRVEAGRQARPAAK